MITDYGKVIVYKDEDGKDQVEITGFTWSGIGEPVSISGQDGLKAAALTWAESVLRDTD